MCIRMYIYPICLCVYVYYVKKKGNRKNKIKKRKEKYHWQRYQNTSIEKRFKGYFKNNLKHSKELLRKSHCFYKC